MSGNSPIYAIVQLSVPDFERYLGDYAMPLQPMLAAKGVKVLAATPDARVIEGSDDHNFTVILEFPSAEVFDTWYASPEYAPLKVARGELTDASATVMTVLPAFQGLPG